MRTKRLMALLALMMALVMLLSACGGGGAPAADQPAADEPAAEQPAADEPAAEEPAAEPAGEDETLYVTISNEPGNIFPLDAEAGDGHWIDWCIYDRLVNFDSDTGELVPGLATDWEWIDDTHLQLTIRDGVVAYDGSIIDANDVMYSIQLGLSGDATTQWAAVDGDECYVVDDHTIVIGMKTTYPTVIGKLSYVAFLTIVDESSVEALGGYDAALRNPRCTTGPYFFDEWKDGEYIRIVRNEDYWGDPGYYKYIQFNWTDDSTAKTMGVAAGDVNFAVEIDSADKLALDAGMYPGCVSYTTSGGGTNVVFFNTTNEYLSNELVREAIYYAIDTDYINQVATDNTGKVADSIISSASPYYKSPETKRENNIEKAKELIAQAGYAEGEIKLTLPAVPPTLAVSNAIAANLQEAGIDATVVSMEILVYLAATDTGDFDLCVQPTFSDDIINYVRYYDDRMALNTRGGGIVGGFEDMYDILDTASGEMDTTKNMAAFGDLQDYVAEHSLTVPLYETTIFYAADGNYTFKNYSNGHINFSTVKPAD